MPFVLPLCLVLAFLVPIPALAAFTDNADGTITDSATGLIWEKDGSNTATWSGALTRCEGLTLAGNSTWRLPDLKELLSLVDFSAAPPSINGAFSGNCQSDWYWSSTSYAGDTSFAWFVYFDGGNAGTVGGTGTGYVRCVRGGPAGSFDPLAILSGAPSGDVTSRSASITVGGTGITQYRYKLDSGNVTRATSKANPIALSGLSLGAHTVEVLGINNASKLQANPTTATWTVTAAAAWTGEGTRTGTGDGSINFPAYNLARYNATAATELARLGIAPGAYNLSPFTSWQTDISDATTLTYLKSGSSPDLKQGVNLMSNGTKSEMVLAGMINATTPALANGYGLFARNTTNLSGAYDVGDLRYVKIKGSRVHFLPLQATAFSPSVTGDIHAYLRDGNGAVITGRFTGMATLYVWVKDNGAYDADPAAGTVADPGLFGTASGSSDSSSTGCVMNPEAGFSLEWMFLAALGGLALVLRRRA